MCNVDRVGSEVFVREDFAAAGGVSTGLQMAGVTERVIGVEFEASACETARAAGHERYHADVREVRSFDWSGMVGYTGGPPCQTFSKAGKGTGRESLSQLAEAAGLVARGWLPESAIAHTDSRTLDERSVLVLEPMLVVHRHRPRWVMLEQVPQVLPVWEQYAELLASEFGYAVETGLLNSEQYGVPQTRRRAVLVASLDGPVSLPTPTHSQYHNRSPKRLDEGVLPWVSMAEALGWGSTDLVGFPRRTDGIGGVVELDGVGYRARDFRAASEPSAAVTGKARSWKRWAFGDVVRKNGTVRDMDQPAPTVTGSADNGNFRFVDRDAVVREVEPRVNNQSGTHFDLSWPCDRPAPTIAGRDIVTMPGANANRYNGSTKSRNDGIRVSVAEAGVLQSFPADYPWQGTKTQRFQQVGNAMPPLLAASVLRPLVQLAQVAA